MTDVNLRELLGLGDTMTTRSQYGASNHQSGIGPL